MADPAIQIQLVFPAKWDKSKKECRTLPFLEGKKAYPIATVLDAYSRTSRLLKDLHDEGEGANAAESLLLEAYRLVLMTAIYHHLVPKKADELAKANEKEKKEKKSQIARIWQKVKTALVVFAGVVGAFETAIWTYFGSFDAMTVLLPTAVGLALIPTCVIFTTVSVVQFFSFEVDQVKQLFGFSAANTEQLRLDTIYEQIKCTKKINKTLENRFNYETLVKANQFDAFNRAAFLFNQDIELRRSTFKEYKESMKKRLLRYSVTLTGLLLTLIEAYFGTSMLIGLVASSIVGTPLAGIVIGLIMMSTAILYFSMRGSGLETMLNAEQDSSKKVHAALKDFELPIDLRLKVKKECQLMAQYEEAHTKKVKEKVPTFLGSVGLFKVMKKGDDLIQEVIAKVTCKI